MDSSASRAKVISVWKINAGYLWNDYVCQLFLHYYYHFTAEFPVQLIVLTPQIRQNPCFTNNYCGESCNFVARAAQVKW